MVDLASKHRLVGDHRPQVDLGHHLIGENAERIALQWVKHSRLIVEHAQRADRIPPPHRVIAM